MNNYWVLLGTAAGSSVGVLKLEVNVSEDPESMILARGDGCLQSE